MKTKTPKAPKADNPQPKAKKCRAAEVGHRSCKCGSPHCGANIHDPYQA